MSLCATCTPHTPVGNESPTEVDGPAALKNTECGGTGYRGVGQSKASLRVRVACGREREGPSWQSLLPTHTHTQKLSNHVKGVQCMFWTHTGHIASCIHTKTPDDAPDYWCLSTRGNNMTYTTRDEYIWRIHTPLFLKNTPSFPLHLPLSLSLSQLHSFSLSSYAVQSPYMATPTSKSQSKRMVLIVGRMPGCRL